MSFISMEILLIICLGALLFSFAVAIWYKKRLTDEKNAHAVVKSEKIRLEAELDLERKTHASFAEQTKSAFAELAADALSKNTDNFIKLAEERFKRLQQESKSDLEKRQESVKNLVEPIKLALDTNKNLMEDMEKKRREAYGQITTQIEKMAQTESDLRKETGKLVNALRVPHVRGRYGEVTLRRVVELAGMNKHCDFIEQEHNIGAEGQILRPDMIVRMPSQRALVIDAKTPLEHYLSAVEVNNDDERLALLKKHAEATRKHVDQLAKKEYSQQLNLPHAPDFVVMFICGDQFLNAALEHGRDLLDYAMRKRIILATPGSLMGLLRAVAYGWHQEEITENLQQISRLGKQLYDRTCIFTDHMNKVGKHLSQSVEAYNQAANSLSSRLTPTARRLSELGIEHHKEVPESNLIDASPRQLPPLNDRQS